MTPAQCHSISAALHARMAADPILHPFFKGKSQRCAIEEFAAFLVQFLGGPHQDTQLRHWLSLHESHQRFKLGPAERAAWLRCMHATLEETELDPALRANLGRFFSVSSSYVISRKDESEVPGELGQRWNAQKELDEAVAALRTGKVTIPPGLDQRPSVFAGFVARIIREGLDDAAIEILTLNPGLVQERYNGSTLLHRAAATGSLPVVEHLLSLGAGPKEKDAGNHTPLYWLANECPGGGAVIRRLVQAGADVNACDGVKHCTPLHMAARRGNIEAARALLDCGANPFARDTQGVTPYQRALNCRKPAVATLLKESERNGHNRR